MKPVSTWIVIADGARARIVRNDGPGKGVAALPGLEFQGDHSAAFDIAADKPGRAFDSVGNARHAMEPSSDPHDELKAQFMKKIVAVLESRQGDFDRLILVAPPQALGLLRKSLPAAVASKVTGELGKDLTQLPNGDLSAHLDGLLVI
jgi:protein required for attachment to host cells